MDELCPLTKEESRVHVALRSYTRLHRRFPTIRQLAQLLGKRTHSATALHIEGLIAKGYLFRRAGRGNRFNGQLYSWTPVSPQSGEAEVRVFVDANGRFLRFAAPSKIQVVIKREMIA